MTHQARLLIRLICASAGVLATTRVDAQCAPERPPDDPFAKITHRAPIPARADVPTLNWPYQQWLTEDVACIITPEERSAFLQLDTDQDRNNFIEQFWYRRNPDPTSEDNAFQKEHYRRIEYANQHFSSPGKAGWASDRGFAYILYGPPNEVRSYPRGPLPRPPEEGDPEGYPFEDWLYVSLEGVGSNIELEFVDPTGTDDYRFGWSDDNPESLFAQPAISSALPLGPGAPLIGLESVPVPQFRDLSALMTARIIRNQVGFDYRVESVRLTDCTALVKIKIIVPTAQLARPENAGEESQPSIQLFARVTSERGRVLSTFEAQREPSWSEGEQRASSEITIEEAVPLFYGEYQLSVAVKDPADGKIGIQKIPLILDRPQ